MSRVGILFATAAALCLAAGVSPDPVGTLRFGAEPASAASAQANAVEPLSANDVSWLFNPPKTPADLPKLIRMSELTANGEPVWSDDVLHQLLVIANGPAGAVPGTMHRINLPAELATNKVWYISGVRFDPSAPGLHPNITATLGQASQIRLIVQPVTDAPLKVHDVAVHLVFSFTREKGGVPDNGAAPDAGCLPLPKPDGEKFKEIIADLVGLRNAFNSGATASDLLGVHPGFKNSDENAISVRNKMKEILERHLSSRNLTVMAITASKEGSNAWIFLSMLHVAPNLSMPGGAVIPLHSPALDGDHFAQLFNPTATLYQVIPVPYPNNGDGQLKCWHAGLPTPGPPIEQRNGASTARFTDPLVVMAKDEALRDAVREMMDRIADPKKSHVFNTDCVSCHTETRIRIQLRRDSSDVPEFDKIDRNTWPSTSDSGNVRGFGWFPLGSGAQATVSHRAAKETFAIRNFINEHCLAAQAGADPSQAPPRCPPE